MFTELKVFTEQDFNKIINLGQDIYLLDEIIVIGSITDLSLNISKPLLSVKSGNNIIDYTKHFKIINIEGSIYQVTSSFKSAHTREMKIIVDTTNNIFDTIHKATLTFTTH